MRRDRQLELMRRLMKHLDEGSTAMKERMFRNPMSAYADPERHKRERQVFFRDRPILMGLSGRVRKPGDYVTDNVDGVPVILVRDRDGVAHTFVNVCRHRGARLVEGEGCGLKMFSCPYHAWTYTLEGRLKGIPDARSFDEVDKSEHGLIEIPTRETHGLIWAGPINPDAPVSERDPLGPLEDEIDEWGFESYVHYDSIRMVRPMNWKFVMDTFMEGYHISALHKNTIDPIVHTNLSTFDAYEDHHRMVIARKTFDELRQAPEDQADLIPYAGFIYSLFPQGMLIVQGAANVELWRVSPTGDNPGECQIEMSSYIPEAPKSEKAENFWRKNFDLAIRTVESEDFTLGATIQDNAAAQLQDEVIYGRNEPALTHYHSGIRRHLGLNSLPGMED